MLIQHLPHGQPCFTVRDIEQRGGEHDEIPLFDVGFCHPTTWHCYYLDDSIGSKAEAEEMAADLNKNGWCEMSLTSMEDAWSLTLKKDKNHAD